MHEGRLDWRPLVHAQPSPRPAGISAGWRINWRTVRLPFPPAFLQRLGFALGAPRGRLLGHGADLRPNRRTCPRETQVMKRRLLIGLIVLALLLLALAGLAVRSAAGVRSTAELHMRPTWSRDGAAAGSLPSRAR
jgi:hypothetical protein